MTRKLTRGQQPVTAPARGPLTVSPAMKNTAARAQDVGKLGEKIARGYLESLGYRILDCNWRVRSGEIDIVALQGETVVAVEVKTRSGTGYGAPLEAITYIKSLRLRRLLAHWLRNNPGTARACRVDGIGVTLRGKHAPKIEHIEGIS